jgi:hypothetical protein
MSNRVMRTRLFNFAAFLAAAVLTTVSFTTMKAGAQDLTGRELLAVTRVASGGPEYSGVQNVTIKSSGFVNMASFAATGAAAVAGAVEVKLNITDYQDRDLKRRLDITPKGPLMGPSYLVYTGTEGGGMFAGNEFRVSEVAASRQWAMMGFNTLNKAIEGQLPTARQKDEGGNYVVEVKFTPADTIRYWIDKNTFLINRVVTRYNSKNLVEEDRSDYRKVGCLMLPFHVVTRLNGQRLADLTVDSYDLQTNVPAAKFTMTAVAQ